MAEHGAHITSAGGAERPTIFEVLAQESLMNSVRPALKHAVRVVAENRPAKFGWLLRYYDELYACLDFLLENYHLRKYYGSFAENFYDLKRVPSGEDSGRLSSGHHWASVFLLVAVPYVKTKMDALFEELRHQYGADRRTQIQSSSSQLTRSFLAIYPYIHMTWEGACLGYQLTYMLGKGTRHSPFLHLSGTELRYIDEFDRDLGGQKVSVDWNNISLHQKFGQLMKKCLHLAAVSLSSGLSIAMFFLQFLDWWYSSDNKATSLTALPIPDPPSDVGSERGLSPLLCPVCGRTRTNDTALSVSGYVFCYPCIHGYIKQHGRCPVTDYPATADHLIKLYLTDM